MHNISYFECPFRIKAPLTPSIFLAYLTNNNTFQEINKIPVNINGSPLLAYLSISGSSLSTTMFISGDIYKQTYAMSILFMYSIYYYFGHAR